MRPLRLFLAGLLLLSVLTSAPAALADYTPEEKQLLELLSTFVMADDTGLLCDAYNTTELGEQDCTKIFVMEKKRFPQWLAERKESLKTISDF